MKYGDVGGGRTSFVNAPPERGWDELPPKAYAPEISMRGVYLRTQVRIGDELIASNHTALRKAIERFWASEEVFRKLGLTYKRGVLLHGKPGCGKTSLVQQFAEEVRELGGVTLFVGDGGAGVLTSFIDEIHAREPRKKIVAVFEDIDRLARRDAALLDYLDGFTSKPHVLNLATTNYLSALPETIRNRPSRFDTVIEIMPPSEGVRKVYMERLFSKLEAPVDDRYVTETEGLSFAEMKELFIATVALDQDFIETLRRFKTVGVGGTAAAGLVITDLRDHNPHECEEEVEDCALCQEYWNEDGELKASCERCESEGCNVAA